MNGARLIRVGLLSALAAAGGCAAGRKAPVLAPTTVPAERMTLSSVRPGLKLPKPATQPTGRTSLAALQAYAQARLFLLDDQKPAAIEKLNAAIELEPGSSTIYRDLGYAWLGTDNDRAFAAFKRSSEFNPADTDVRCQLARLLSQKEDYAGATEQLLLARLSPEYSASSVRGAVVDVLLGQLLTNRGYTTSAVECLESALPVVESRSMEVRARPELYELVVVRPYALRMQIADLSVKIGRYDRAIDLYEQIQKAEPSFAPALELRIIQALASKGDMERAAPQMLRIVEQFGGSRSSIQAYIDLFNDHGGDARAYETLLKVTPTDKPRTISARVLEARLLRRLKKPADAAVLLDEPSVLPTLPVVRETVMAYREAGRDSELPTRLMKMMADHPALNFSIWRGWEIITQTAQPNALGMSALASMTVAPELEPAKLYVVARLGESQGQPVVTKQALAKASALDARRVGIWRSATPYSGTADVDFNSDRDMALFIDEFSNDPKYLGVMTAQLVRAGHTDKLTNAFQSAIQRNPANLAAVAQLAALLDVTDQRSEALRIIETSADHVKSGAELYNLALLYSERSEHEMAEKMLRRAYAADPNYASTCNDLGYLLADAGREMDFAESLLWKAVGMESMNPAFVDSLGWVLYKRGKFDQASLYLEQALSASDPPDPVVLDHAGDAAYRLAGSVKARQRWQKALDSIKAEPDSASSTPQLRLRLEQKIRQLDAGEKVDVAPALEG